MYFYILILITGILSIYTDCKEEKIKNSHILSLSSLSIITYSIFFITGKLNMSVSLILNPLVGLLIGFLLYISKLWKAGDAKLFFVYSLLLPKNRYPSILPFSSLVLFFNTFLISFFFVVPMYLKSIIDKKNKVINGILSKKTFTYFGKIFLITFGISWIIIPILNLFSLKENIFLNFILLYIGYSIVYIFINKIKYKFVMLMIFIVGFILRYIFMPNSFSFIKILHYLKHLLGYSLIFYILKEIEKLEETKSQRIPFAPLIFLGAILSNTHFLWWIVKILSYLR